MIQEVDLVGGSGPHEGNILVGGLPVCDDGHNADNALVVCRLNKTQLTNALIIFINILMIIPCKTLYCPLLMHNVINTFFLGCWGSLVGHQLMPLNLGKSVATSGWTTSSAQATNLLFLTVLITLKTTAVLMRGLESFVPMVGHMSLSNLNPADKINGNFLRG